MWRDHQRPAVLANSLQAFHRIAAWSSRRPWLAPALASSLGLAVLFFCAGYALVNGRLPWEAPPDLQQVLQTLHRPDAQQRLEAVRLLARIQDPAAARALAGLVLTDERIVWEEALRVLRKKRDESAVRLFADALGSPDPRTRAQAAYALGELGDRRAVIPLLAHLSDTQPCQTYTFCAHSEIVTALARLRDSRAIAPLVNHLVQMDARSVPSTHPHCDVVQAILNSDDQTGTEVLLKAAADQPWEVCERVIGAMQALVDRDGCVQRLRTHRVTRCSVRPLLPYLDSADPKLRLLSALVLLRLEEATPRVMALLRSPDMRVRARVLAELARFPSSRWLKVALDCSRDPNQEIRKSAIGVLASIKEPAAMGALVDVLTNGPASERQSVAVILRSLNGPEYLEAWKPYLAHPNREVRSLLVEVVAGCQHPDAVPILMEAVADTDLPIRSQAVAALKERNDSRALEVMLSALRDPDPVLRRAAAEYLNGVKLPRGDQVLRAMLKHNDEFIRLSSIHAWGRSPDPEAERVLISLLAESSPAIRRAAAEHAGGWPRGREALLARIRAGDLDVVAGAHRFLIARAEPGSEAILIQALNARGDAQMALNFVNSRNDELAAAGQGWCSAHNLAIRSLDSLSPSDRVAAGQSGPTWGGGSRR